DAEMMDGEGDGEDNEDEEDREDGDAMDVDGDGITHKAKVREAKAWVDSFIINSRRQSGRQTEESILVLWNRWLVSALASGTVPDIIVDADHTIVYLKFAATRNLLTTNGTEQQGKQQFCPLSDEDFDVTQNTILDSEILPEHFGQITRAIFLTLDQIPSIVKAHFSWTWQCTTLNQGDELVNLLLCCLQPYRLFVPDYTTADGCRSGRGQHIFGQEPDYNFVLPHRDPLHCPVGALAILLYFMFDQGGLMAKFPEWDWSKSVTWRKASAKWPTTPDHQQHDELTMAPFQVKLLFGRAVGKPCSGDALRKMYGKFLEPTTIKSRKKLHLARRTMPAVMEEMGVNIDKVDGIGHWAVTALAGFYVGEHYQVPWAAVDVPAELQTRLFPFVESALADLKTAEHVNHGTVNFLQLLQQLQPFFWRVTAAIHHQFPELPLFKRFDILHSDGVVKFRSEWPAALCTKEADAQVDTVVTKAFQDLEDALHLQTEKLDLIARRTEQFSPSKSRVARQP
ncbi:hypothetical protein DFH94DRAFT_616994, partial [Russula ochroleuca]